MSKTVVVTGGAKGIGAATSTLFAINGYNVVINYNTSEACALDLMNKLNNEGYNVSIFKADISKKDEAEKLMEHTLSTFGSVDILINNAGIAQQKLFTDITNEDWNKMISVDLTGTYNCCKAVVPYFVLQKSGSIVNVSSVWGIVGASCEVHYSAAKAGIIGLTKALAKELGPSNIRVNCIAPGVIDTDMNSNHSTQTIESLCFDTPLCRIGNPQEVAEAILFLASEKASFITGQILSVDGGFAI